MAEKEVNVDENTIYVGNKPPMSYVLAVVTQFNGGSEEVRGKIPEPIGKRRGFHLHD